MYVQFRSVGIKIKIWKCEEVTGARIFMHFSKLTKTASVQSFRERWGLGNLTNVSLRTYPEFSSTFFEIRLCSTRHKTNTNNSK